ncbi:hypothetical protein F8M41_009898 [Gigaspora margarita]|uniref:Uncharacterized protein n=1 Tax=Gigaspora margarita TaxID=4874 RepID=A0A8H4A3N5_GIGMA|nr:hypothetical protein F8M41_009898 [Gigaspora margarita]
MSSPSVLFYDDTQELIDVLFGNEAQKLTDNNEAQKLTDNNEAQKLTDNNEAQKLTNMVSSDDELLPTEAVSESSKYGR